jgi:predicted nucleic acid-binding protein
VLEKESKVASTLLGADAAIVVWRGALVECGSALARRGRENSLDAAALQATATRMKRLSAGWMEVPPSDEVRSTALRMLRVHSLRAADALHLAAAFVVADARPESLDFVTFDARLAAAATLEGFRVVTHPSTTIP